MIDKQIIIDASKCEWRTGVGHCGNYECMLNKCCDYNCDWYKRRKLEQQLKVKEQECNQLKAENDELKRYKFLFEKARDLWNEASRQKNKLLDENKDLKDSLKRTICQSECYRYKEAEKFLQTLTEIKPILEIYANSNMGEEQPDKTYHIRLDGGYIMVYDPQPARQALQKISECEDRY